MSIVGFKIDSITTTNVYLVRVCVENLHNKKQLLCLCACEGRVVTSVGMGTKAACICMYVSLLHR